jgi:hypothetical protein
MCSDTSYLRAIFVLIAAAGDMGPPKSLAALAFASSGNGRALTAGLVVF